MCISIFDSRQHNSSNAAYVPSVSLAALVASVRLGAWCGVRVITAWENCDLWFNCSRTKSPSWRTRPPSWSCFTVNSNVKSYYSRSEENSCCARLLFNQPFSLINMGLGRSSDGLSRKSSGDRCIKIFYMSDAFPKHWLCCRVWTRSVCNVTNDSCRSIMQWLLCSKMSAAYFVSRRSKGVKSTMLHKRT